MSQAAAGDKTEKATPQKLRKAREEGQVARSRDVGTAIGLFVALKILIWMMPSWLIDFRRVFALSLVRFPNGGSWSFFLCPCGRRARIIRLFEGGLACRQCLGNRGLRPRVQLIATHKRAAYIAPPHRPPELPFAGAA